MDFGIALPTAADNWKIVQRAEELDKLPSFRAMAGMPVEVYIRTGDRTFFEYITRPVVNSFSRAFREL